MANILLVFIASVVFSCAVAFSEAGLKLSNIQGRDFSTISVDDARILAERAGDTGIGRIADAFVQGAMQSGRLELMELCWENRYVSGLFREEYRKMPDNHLKDQLFSSHLRNPRLSWPDDNKMEIYSLNPRFGLVDFYILGLQKYLPDLPKDYSVLNTREKRLKLADAFDKAAGIPIVVEPEARRIGPPPRPGKPAPSSVVPTNSRATGASPVAMTPGEETGLFRDRNFVWLSVFAAALAGAAAWLCLRPRRKV